MPGTSRQIEMESKTRKAAEEDLEGDQIFRSLLTDLLPDLQIDIEGGHNVFNTSLLL